MPERGDYSRLPSSSFSPSSPSPSSSSHQCWSSSDSSIIRFKSFMWKNANQMGKVDCFLPRLSADLTHWDLQDTGGSKQRVNRTNTNATTLSAVDEGLEQLTVPCVTNVSVCTWHVLHNYIHCEKVVHPAVTTITLRPALTEADKTMSLPCGACPGSLFEQFQSCCAVVPFGAHEHS